MTMHTVINAFMMMAAGGGLTAPDPILVTEDVYWANVSLQMDATGKSDGTGYTTGDSRWAQTFTYSGNAQVTSDEFVFDGTGDVINTAASGYAFKPRSAFTAEAFGVKFASTSGVQFIFGHDNRQTIDNGRDWRVVYDGSTGQLYVTVVPDGTNAGTEYTASFAFAPVVGTPYDIAWGWDGANIRIYVDGVYKAKVANTLPSTLSTDQGFRLGSQRFNGADTDFFNGSIAAVRITRGVDRMGASETTYQRHALPLCAAQASTSDPYLENVVLNVHGQGADASTVFTDLSPFDRPMSAVGSAQNDTGISVNGTPSISLGADGTYVLGEYSSDLNIDLSTTDFCMEAYGYLTTIASVNNQLFGRRRNAGQYIVDVDNGNLRFVSFNSTTGTLRLSAASGMSINTPYHICIIRVGAVYYAFRDGTLLGSATSGGGAISTNTTGILIGDSENDQATRYWRGSVNWARITMGHSRYNVAGFTPDSVPYATV